MLARDGLQLIPRWKLPESVWNVFLLKRTIYIQLNKQAQ